jgi:UDP-N-acetylmuramoyl-tripeptide--D-alanyl-D-alanine ligase
MKYLFKKILQYYLKYLTKLVLFIHRPIIIAIAGSTNKTFVRDAVSEMLKGEGRNVCSNPKSFNTEIGLPLAILNLPSGYSSYKNWLPIILKAPTQIFAANFPKILVLELGASDRGDMKYLLSIISPKIAIITDITQRYIEGFGYMDELVKEYEYLAKKAKKSGLIVLNYDNAMVRSLAKGVKAKIAFFSPVGDNNLDDASLWQAIGCKKEENGQSVKVNHNNIISEHKINRFGEHHIHALLISLIIKDYVEKEEKKN